MYRKGTEEERKEWTHFSNAGPKEIRNMMEKLSIGLIGPGSPQ